MARFYDEIGFGQLVETAPGVWEDGITVRKYHGSVLRNTRQSNEGEGVNNTISVGNSISIVADKFALTHYFDMRYVKWAGRLWTVDDVEVLDSPRLTLRLGGVYNGPSSPTPSAA